MPMSNVTHRHHEPEVELTGISEDSSTDKEQEALLTTTKPTSSPAEDSLPHTILPDASILQSARRLLYVSHLLAQFSEISWQFSLTVFLAAITNYQSLVWVASYGLTTGTAVTLLGSSVGSWVDRTNRLWAARSFLLTQNLCVVLATLFCFWLLSREEENEESVDTYSLGLIVGIHVLGAAARILDEGFLVAIERDWVVVMSEHAPENSSTWLSETNVTMKQIDLGCKVVAPAIWGFLIALVDNRNSDSSVAGHQFRYAALAVGAINILALVVEYYCTAAIYQALPNLAIRKLLPEDEEEEEEVSQDEANPGKTHPQKSIPIESKCGSLMAHILPQGIQTYLQQKTAFAGLGLAMLYLNALTFDAIFTAYLVWRGMGLETIGVWRGISSAIGLLGTCVYHWSVKQMSLEATGMWSIVYEFVCLSLSYASLFVNNRDQALGMLIAGVCASRIGLWVFDIAVTQMMQESVPDGVRGVVGGVQQSLNAFFNLLSFLLGIIFPDPSDFHIYVAAGYGSVGLAVLLFGVGTFGTNIEGRACCR